MRNKNIISGVMVIFMLIILNYSMAQEKIPREYVPLEGKITLNKNIPFPTALTALSEISARIEKKIIVDPTNQRSKINIDVKNLHWHDALELILKVNIVPDF